MNMYLVCSVFVSRPTFLLVFNRVVFFFIVLRFLGHYINIIDIDHKLVYSIQFQAILIFLDLPNNVFESKV